MANGIIPLQWGKELRPSAVNSLDKINEVIHFINQSDIPQIDNAEIDEIMQNEESEVN